MKWTGLIRGNLFMRVKRASLSSLPASRIIAVGQDGERRRRIEGAQRARRGTEIGAV